MNEEDRKTRKNTPILDQRQKHRQRRTDTDRARKKAERRSRRQQTDNDGEGGSQRAQGKHRLMRESIKTNAEAYQL